MSGQASDPKTWSEWYRFARDKLGFRHDECVEYANLRYVEQQNRAALRERAGAQPQEPAPNSGLAS